MKHNNPPIIITRYVAVKSLLGLLLLSYSALSWAGGPPAGCHSPIKTCIEPGETRTIDGVLVHEDCWRYQVVYQCPNWSSVKNSCQDDINCTAEGPPTPISPYIKHQLMQCSTTTISNVCDHYTTRKDCGGKFSYTQDQDKFTPTGTTNFAHAAASMGAMDAMQKNMHINPLSVFTGSASHCVRPVSLGPFTVNCCDKSLHTHGSKWYHVNRCDSEAIALATARRAKRTQELGWWCTKHLPWPLDGVCIESTQTACRFTSLFARVIAQQGRKQINAIAAGGGKGTTTQPLDWAYSGLSGAWHHATADGTAVATYTWPVLQPAALPLAFGIVSPLDVHNGQTAQLNDVSITLDCQADKCTGMLSQGAQQRPYLMQPSCNRPGNWALNRVGVSQGVCAPVGTTPKGWSPITWSGSTPNHWQFTVSIGINETMTNNQLSTTLPGNAVVTAHSHCNADNCSINAVVTKAGHTDKGTLSFPLACTKGTDYQQTINGVSIMPRCHLAGVIMAVCTKGVHCGALPTDPGTTIGSIVNGWQLTQEPKDVPKTTFITPFVAVKGACTHNQCHWQLLSLGPKGFSTDIASHIQFNLFSAKMVNHKIVPGFADTPVATPTNIYLKPYAYAPGTDVATGFRLEYQLPGADTWEQYPHLIPLSVTKAAPIILSSSPRIALYGSCEALSGHCAFTVLGNVQVHGMPWGDAEHPHCEGFTTGELMLLDFSTMDLSEWLHSVTPNVGPGEQDQLSKLARESMNNFNHNMHHNGTDNSEVPSRDDRIMLNVTPREGQGPFDVTLTATAFWPKFIPYGQCGYPASGTQNPAVTSVAIVWGDGQHTTLTQTKSVQVAGQDYQQVGPCTYSVPVLQATHHYTAPPGHNVLENIIGTFTVNGKTYTAPFTVDNFYDTPGSTDNTGGGVAPNRTHPVHPNQMPGSNPYHPNAIPGVQKKDTP